jgi:hypothetical protein
MTADNHYVYNVPDVIKAINNDKYWVTDCYGYIKLCSAIALENPNKTVAIGTSVAAIEKSNGRPKLTPGMNVYSTKDTGGSHIMMFLYADGDNYYFADQGKLIRHFTYIPSGEYFKADAGSYDAGRQYKYVYYGNI